METHKEGQRERLAARYLAAAIIVNGLWILAEINTRLIYYALDYLWRLGVIALWCWLVYRFLRPWVGDTVWRWPVRLAVVASSFLFFAWAYLGFYAKTAWHISGFAP